MASSSSSQICSFSEFGREASTVSNKLYDAFINHRGPDVKETVAFALYESLEEKDCWTFLDDQELELGDSIPSAIQNAIYSSSVQIAIFSPRYAESPWCLNELVLMLKTKARFIPVFCNVKPYDLRYPDKGVYKDAFAKHEAKGRFSNDTLSQWKKALHDSSLKSGQEFKISTEDLQTSLRISGEEFRTTNDNVEMLCTKIALAVQQEVGKTYKKHQIGLHADAAASTSRSSSAQGKKSSLMPRDSHPVGIHSKVEQMEGLLEDPKVPLIVVVGMGGLGKTFLLRNVYNKIKSRFDICIWLSISKSYSVKNLQRNIAAQMVKKMKKNLDAAVSEETAAELIHDSLKGKKSLIVLDDLWTVSAEYNLIDKLGLPSDEDCKVVVTTRNRQVATQLKVHDPYEMQYLSDEESWRLFCAYAFPKSEGNREAQHLEEEGRKIVKKCGNLPLAIKTIAASLANTRLLREWENKRHQLERVVTPIGDGDNVMEILRLSYDSLPARLQACFAYFSFFPEDEEIDCEYLINVWIGEGFIPAGEEQRDMAWDWLDQLADLCLLQLGEKLMDSDTREECVLTKYCRIHDLLLDLAIHISREDKCAFSVKEASTHTVCRRILLAKKAIDDNAISESRPVYLRTLSFSQNKEITSIPVNLFTAMRGLRVLDLSSTYISTLPESVGKMILLKVLNLRKTRIKKVPECVRHLKSLLYLAIPEGCDELREWISELKCLEHLECKGIGSMPKGISELASLRTLRSDFLSLYREEEEEDDHDEFMSIEEEEFMSIEEEEDDDDEFMRIEEEEDDEFMSIEEEEDDDDEFMSIEEEEFMRIEEEDDAEFMSIEEEEEEDKLLRIEDLANMTQLEELWLEVNPDNEEGLKRILAQLVKMRRLRIRNETGEDLQLPEEMRAMKHLESLRLESFAVPSWICELANLRELELRWCESSDYPELQRMPNLVRLELCGNSTCKELPKAFGKSGGFSHLRFFTIQGFIGLKEFQELEEGAMPCLEVFSLIDCHKLKKVGGGLERLKRLKEFYYSGSRKNEWSKTLQVGEEYWNKIIAINPQLKIYGCS